MRGGQAIETQDAAEFEPKKPMDGLTEYKNKIHQKALRLLDALPERPSCEDLSRAAESLEQAMDTQVFRFAGKLDVLHQETGSPTLACRRGCSHCCGTQVTATIPEVLRLAAWIQENYSPEELAHLKERLAKFREWIVTLPNVTGPRPPRDCPILQENSCPAHLARPIACRGANSISAEACREARENWSDTSFKIPQLAQPQFAAKALVSGLREAMVQRGLNSPVVEMPIALEIALNDPSAGERFLAGENVFETAIRDLDWLPGPQDVGRE